MFVIFVVGVSCCKKKRDKRMTMRRSGLVTSSRLWHKKSAKGSVFGSGFRHPMTGKLLLSTHQLKCTCFDQGIIRQKSKRWVAPFICFAQGTVGF